MNERIKQLLNEATSGHEQEYDALKYMTVSDKEMDKFAQLIVQAAIGVLQRRFMGDLNREDMEVRRCVEDVKKYFGVEE